jgi:hypothetical protein
MQANLCRLIVFALKTIENNNWMPALLSILPSFKEEVIV